MRHKKHRGKLNRTTSERRALLRSLVFALLKNQRITTTVAKAKEARKLADRVISLGKYADLASRRRAFAILLDRSLVKELFNEIAPRFKNRQGGYTRIIKLYKHRKGDNAPLALLELTEQKVVTDVSKKGKKGKAQEAQEPKEQKESAKEQPKEKPVKAEGQPKEVKKEEKPIPPKEERHLPKIDKHPPRGEKRHLSDKSKKGFFQGLKKFLKPKTGT